MPLSVVVGGQFGSEGKGKVVGHFAKLWNVDYAVKVSGTNAGHTVVGPDGKSHILRVLPSACVYPWVEVILPAGCSFRVDLLLKEISELGVKPECIHIHPNAGIITDAMKQEEKTTGLVDGISSTGSGTGACLYHRIIGDDKFVRAFDIPELSEYITDTTLLMRKALDVNKHILIEGCQGFGLSILHTEYYPYCTSRDTTASGYISEAGLSPFDVTNIVMVLRSYSIRVAGNSGPLPFETTWEQVTRDARSPRPIIEMTSVTRRVRRVAKFDPRLVKQAYGVNKPNIVVMNFMDYIYDEPEFDGMLGPNRLAFLDWVYHESGCKVTHVGFGAGDVRAVEEAMPSCLGGSYALA